jgi:Tfp pilus assembly protein PilZ
VEEGKLDSTRSDDKKGNYRGTRIPAEYEVEYRMGTIVGKGYITDISEGGVAMRTNQVFVIGDELHLKSDISTNLTLEFAGEVRNTQGNIIGIMITDIDPEVQQRFMDHIEGVLRMINRERKEKFTLHDPSSKRQV